MERKLIQAGVRRLYSISAFSWILLRFQQLCIAMLATMTVIGACVLVPIYYNGHNIQDIQGQSVLAQFSITNVTGQHGSCIDSLASPTRSQRPDTTSLTIVMGVALVFVALVAHVGHAFFHESELFQKDLAVPDLDQAEINRDTGPAMPRTIQISGNGCRPIADRRP